MGEVTSLYSRLEISGETSRDRTPWFTQRKEPSNTSNSCVFQEFLGKGIL